MPCIHIHTIETEWTKKGKSFCQNNKSVDLCAIYFFYSTFILSLNLFSPRISSVYQSTHAIVWANPLYFSNSMHFTRFKSPSKCNKKNWIGKFLKWYSVTISYHIYMPLARMSQMETKQWFASFRDLVVACTFNTIESIVNFSAFLIEPAISYIQIQCFSILNDVADV